MKTNLLILALILFSIVATAQDDSYIPLNIKNAYKKNTRSYDGKPGENYWQNRSEYKINIKLDPKTKILEGTEQIKYYNNSPDSLSEIVIRLYHNINKPNAKRDFNLNEKSVTEGVLIKSFIIDGNKIDVTDKSVISTTGTNLVLKLKNKISPKNNTDLEIDWSVKIPEVQSVRFGSYDSTTMFVAYWYPQISVYDDIDGWDKMDYSGLVEMYNDFNSYDVSINVPVGFHIWATGVWQNADEILKQKYLDK